MQGDVKKYTQPYYEHLGENTRRLPYILTYNVQKFQFNRERAFKIDTCGGITLNKPRRN